MNILRKLMSAEVEALKPLLDDAYAAILRFQPDRSIANEYRLREAMGLTIERLQQFKPLLPRYKQRDFDALHNEWQTLPPGDLIMLFDHCISIMHVRLERRRDRNEVDQPWSRAMLRLLDSYRDAPGVEAVAGEFLCSGIAASGGRASGIARVARDDAALHELRSGEILVCRFTRPDVVPWLREMRALVTDEGGTLSHAAIIAREIGVPAVTGCGNATTVIRTGMELEVDGDLGIVNRVRAG